MPSTFMSQVISQGIGGTMLGGEGSTKHYSKFADIVGALTIHNFLLTSHKTKALRDSQLVPNYRYSVQVQTDMRDWNNKHKMENAQLRKEQSQLQLQILGILYPHNPRTVGEFNRLVKTNYLLSRYSADSSVQRIITIRKRLKQIKPYTETAITKITDYALPKNVRVAYQKQAAELDRLAYINKDMKEK